LAYFSIALKGLSLDESISITQVKQLQGFGKSERVIPAILIGQLGKNDHFRNDITGQYILEQVFSIIQHIQYLAGGRLAVVECRSEPKLRDYYERNGFVFLQLQNGYLQFIKRL